MKSIVTLLLVFSWLGALSQDTLRPQLGWLPQISPDTVQKYEANLARYNKLNEQINASGEKAVSEADFQFWLENESIEMNNNPFATEYAECSWYCAGQAQRIRASSALQSTGSFNYEGKNAHDFDLRSAWAVNNSNGGIGETLTIHMNLSKTLGITTINFHNGYQKSERVWKNNSRVKTALLSVDGVPRFVLELADDMSLQEFDIGQLFATGQEGVDLEFKILAIYPGATSSDLCISEINFDGIGDH